MIYLPTKKLLKPKDSGACRVDAFSVGHPHAIAGRGAAGGQWNMGARRNLRGVYAVGGLGKKGDFG